MPMSQCAPEVMPVFPREDLTFSGFAFGIPESVADRQYDGRRICTGERVSTVEVDKERAFKRGLMIPVLHSRVAADQGGVQEEA